jgi:hypothetical protein
MIDLNLGCRAGENITILFLISVVPLTSHCEEWSLLIKKPMLSTANIIIENNYIRIN